MGAWTGFFETSAAASATLVGLLVVAISINISRILGFASLPDRAASALIPLAGVLVVCLLALVPQPTWAFAGEVLVTGVAIWAQTGRLLFRWFRNTEGVRLQWVLFHIPLNQVQTVPFIVAGVLLALGFPSGLYWIVPGVIASLLAGLLNTWVLLVEILR